MHINEFRMGFVEKYHGLVFHNLILFVNDYRKNPAQEVSRRDANQLLMDSRQISKLYANNSTFSDYLSSLEQVVQEAESRDKD